MTPGLARLCMIALLAYSSYAICRIPLLPLLASDLGADARMVGLIVGASTLTGVLVKLPAGALSDVLGRRPLLVTGAIVFAVMPFTYIGVASLSTLVTLRFVHGSATAIFGPVASASLSDVAPVGRRGTWLSTYSAVQGAGQALGPVVAGYLVASGRYDLAFGLAGLLALVTPLLASRWPSALPSPSSSPSPSTAHPLQRFTEGIAEVGRDRLILLTSLAQAAQFMLYGTLNAFLPLFAREILGMSASGLGWLFALQTVTTLAIRPLTGMFSDRVGRRGVIVAGLVLSSSAVVLISTVTAVPALVPAVVLYAAGIALTAAAASAYITDLSHRARYGAAHGVFGTIYDVGDATGPIAAGFLVAAVGYAATFRIMACVTLAITLLFVFGTRQRPAG